MYDGLYYLIIDHDTFSLSFHQDTYPINNANKQ